MYKKGKKQYAHERLCSGHDQFSPVVTKLTGFFFKTFPQGWCTGIEKFFAS